MSVWPVQHGGVGAAARLPGPSCLAPHPVRWPVLTWRGGPPSRAIPSDQRVGHGPEGGTDSFSPAILPMPTFGKSRSGYLSRKSWISDPSDDQHASPVAVTGLARIPGSNDG
jgi:hypothetical protein